MGRRTLLLLILLTFLINIQGQSRYFKRTFLAADFNLINEEYDLALQKFEKLLSTDPDNGNLNFLCGFCMLESGGDVDQIIEFLMKASSYTDRSYKDGSYRERNSPMLTYFLLGRAYHMNNQFDYAIQSYERYLLALDRRNYAEINLVNAHINACKEAQYMINYPVDVLFQPFGEQLNLEGNIYNPVISGDSYILIFLSERNNVVYIMDSRKEGNSWTEPEVINSELDMPGNFLPVSLSYDGTELYLVSDSYSNKDIYVSHYLGNRWSKIQKLNRHINSRFNETHASVSKDGQILVFTSDRRGGMGGLDIYYARRVEGDKWGKALNLGPNVNSYFEEDTPFLAFDDTRLYFSSQGHNTMGGYDIFICNITPEGIFEAPENMGYPLNTSRDDLFFNPSWGTAQALYAMNTENPEGYLEIYHVEVHEREQYTTYSESPVFRPPPIQRDPAPVTEVADEEPDIFTEIRMKQEELDSYIEKYNITNTILFEYNESAIGQQSMQALDRISGLMNENPDINIELTGHTDSRGTSEYNMILSERRAMAVYEYLISKGVERERINLQAVGESDPIAVNQYEDGSDAPEGRKLNRSVSIKLSNLTAELARIANRSLSNEFEEESEKQYTILMFRSNGQVTSTPSFIMGEEVSMIESDQVYLYKLGTFSTMDGAALYLSELIGNGFPDARIVEQNELQNLIRDKTLANLELNNSCYTIQFMMLRYPRDVSYFSNLENVSRYVTSDGLYRFVSGEYSTFEDASKQLPAVKSLGYTDAMILPCTFYLSSDVQNQQDE